MLNWGGQFVKTFTGLSLNGIIICGERITQITERAPVKHDSIFETISDLLDDLIFCLFVLLFPSN